MTHVQVRFRSIEFHRKAAKRAPAKPRVRAGSRTAAAPVFCEEPLALEVLLDLLELDVLDDIVVGDGLGFLGLAEPAVVLLPDEVPFVLLPPDVVLLLPEMGTVLLTIGTGIPVPAGEVAAAGCDVTTEGCVSTADGCPVTTPIELVSVRYEVNPLVYENGC